MAGFNVKWAAFVRAFIDNDGYKKVLTGLQNTLIIAVVGLLIGIVIGTIIAAIEVMPKYKRLPRILDKICRVYVAFFRGTPLLMQLFFLYYTLPQLVPAFNIQSRFLAAWIAFSLNVAAYLAEIIRAGIAAVDKGQWEAARSIGLSETHVMTHVILPQAVKNILPALCNEFISTVKGTSLASVFFVGELMTSFKTVQSATFLALQSLTIVGIIYFLLNFILSRLLRVIERRLTVSD